jgi:superfamily II DNA or RNA helicase
MIGAMSARESSAPPIVVDDAAIRRSVTANALAAGRSYALRGRVRILRRSFEDRIIEAETRGSASKPYRQSIAILRDGKGRITVDGECTCPVGGNCKHVAAVLIAARLMDAAATPPAVRAAPPPAEPALPYEVATWLQSLDQATEPQSEDFPPTVRQRLFYVLDSVPDHRGGMLRIESWTATLRKDGTPGPARRHPLHQANSTARYLRPSDRRILRRLARLGHGGINLEADDDPPELLRRIIATGRARWGTADGPALVEGPPRPGRITWALNPDGRQQARLSLDPGLAGFRLPAPWYADPATGTIGPVDPGLPEALAMRLLAAPPIAAATAPKVAAELARRLPTLAVPAPATLAPPETLRGPVVPRLRLTTGSLSFLPGRRARPGFLLQTAVRVPLAQLGFGYGPVTVPSGQYQPDRTLAHDGRLYRLQRDRAGELTALARLDELGFSSVGNAAPNLAAYRHGEDFLLVEDVDGQDWLDFMLHDLPALRSEGWAIEIAEDFPIRLVEPEGPIEAELSEGQGIDWLELHLGVVVDGQRVDLVPALVQLIAEEADGGLLTGIEADDEAPILVPLPDGRLLSLPPARLRPTLLALAELFAGGGIDPGTGRIGFTRLDAAALAQLEEASGLDWQGGEAMRALGRQLREAGGAIPPASLPAGFHGTLRPYQAQGVAWLQFLRTAGLGGVLADDMGLGKTVQTLAHLAIEQAAGRLDRPALIVCPTSLIPNWTLEAARFAPELKLLPLHGKARKDRFDEIAAHDLVLTTYPLLARDHAVLTAQDWHAVVLDEAQTIKNPAAETTRQALRLKARQRLCLSGTPLQNHLGELWSLFDFIAPGFLGNAKAFRSRYRTPIEKHGDAERQAMLHRRVRPFLLRRTKGEVAQQLPPKTEITEPVELGDEQRAIYEGIRLAMHRRVRTAIAERGLARSGIIILDALLKLRQACCDPRLLKLKAAQQGKAGSAKLDRLMDLLEVLLAEDRRVLVFSQFTSMLALIEARLAAAGIGHVLLTGDTRDRATPVRRFQAGEVPAFLISLKAGGVGLNLTRADTVIHYDPWWNPAVEDQATDRAHRIGQERNVFVHRLIALGTIEEKMAVLKDRKRALVAAVLDAEQGGALKLTEADIEALFEAG